MEPGRLPALDRADCPIDGGAPLGRRKGRLPTSRASKGHGPGRLPALDRDDSPIDMWMSASLGRM